MTPTQPADQVRSLRSALQMIDSQVSETQMPTEYLSQLKSDVDNLRLRLWAIISASDGDGRSVERFRLRRALEIMHQLTGELERGAIRPEYPEMTALAEVAIQFSVALRAARGR